MTTAFADPGLAPCLPDGPAPRPGQRFVFNANVIGPTWKRDPSGEWLLPTLTLGWQILSWIKKNCLNLDGKPFVPTHEQARFILWWYAVDSHGRFIYRDGVLQRLKGWGKDPIAACIAAAEFVGPCRFIGWSKTVRRDDDGVIWANPGDPVAGENPKAWVQVAAVSKVQTQNTMNIFPGLFTEECTREHRIDPGSSMVFAHGGRRRIQAVTSSPRALEGGRPTFVIRNETHHWIEANEGIAMADVIARNATKSADGAARALSITNAYEPSEDSVAQRQREAYEDEAAGLSMATGILYDSIEAPKDARLVFDGTWLFELVGEEVPPEGGEREAARERLIVEYLQDIIMTVRGDSIWLDPERLVLAVLDRNFALSQSRRFWFNQVVAAEDAWVDPAAVELSIDPDAQIAIRDYPNDYAAGWLVSPDEPVALFMDGSKSDDSTGIIGTCIDRDFSFVVGVWEKPKGERGKKWLSPRGEVRERGLEATRRMNVVAFWGDPSHTKDDADESRYWDTVFDAWHRALKDKIDTRWWATRNAERAHAIMWDMASPERTAQFVAAAMRTVDEFETLNDIEEFEPQIHIDGHPALVQHLRNAKKNPNSRYGVSLMKENRESARKIDLAVCLVGARMLRRVILNLTDEAPPAKGGQLWW